MNPRPADEGFSLVELIIAMFFLAILSLAVLPLLIGVAGTSTNNRDYVKATSFANEQLASLRAVFPLDSGSTCSSLRSEAAAMTPTPGPSGSGMSSTVDVSSCRTGSSNYPASVTVTVMITDASGNELTVLPTRFRVAAP